MDNTKQCWYCGKGTMVNKGDYFQCSNCGATWNWQPVLLSDGLVVESLGKGQGTKYRPYKRRGKRAGAGKS